MLLFKILVTTFLSFSIEVVDKTAENKGKVIEEVLAVQRALIYDPHSPVPFEGKEKGFLTVRMCEETLFDLLDKEGKIITARSNDRMVGYLLLSDCEDFLSWAENKKFESSWTIAQLRAFLSPLKVQYIDQIGVKHEYARLGVGTALVNKAQSMSEAGLITDILCAPHQNEASIAFFTKKGFVEIGVVHVDAHPVVFFDHKTALFFFKPVEDKKVF